MSIRCPIQTPGHVHGKNFSSGLPGCGHVFYWEESDGLFLGLLVASSSSTVSPASCIVYCSTCKKVLSNRINSFAYWSPGQLWSDAPNNAELSAAFAHRAICRPPVATSLGKGCSICMDRPIQQTLQCGNMFCTECGDSFKSCPTCRVEVTQRIKLFPQ